MDGWIAADETGWRESQSTSETWSEQKGGKIFAPKTCTTARATSVSDSTQSKQGSMVAADSFFLLFFGRRLVKKIKVSERRIKRKKRGGHVSSINLSISINPIRSNRCREEIMTSGLGTFYTKKKEKKIVEFPPTFRVATRAILHSLGVTWQTTQSTRFLQLTKQCILPYLSRYIFHVVVAHKEINF